MKIIKFLIPVMFFALNISSCEKLAIEQLSTTSAMSIDPNFHLYYLIGQSNMAGRGDNVAEYINMGHPRVLMLNKDNNWVIARNPLHFDKPADVGVGPGLAFAIKMAENDPTITIGLIPCAVGGSNINAWKPGGTHVIGGVTLHPYDDGLIRANIAQGTGVMKGILFHQGEANSGGTNYVGWNTKVKTLIDNLRSEFSNTNLPFLIGELGYFRPTSHTINDQIPQIVIDKQKTGRISAFNLTSNPDMIHFDNRSANLLGNRYADAMLSQYGITPQPKSTGLVLDDSFIRNGSYSGTNYGAGTVMDLKASTVADYLRKSLVKVAVEVDHADNITSVILKLYCNAASGSSTISLYSQNPNWDEAEVNFNNAPAQTTLIKTVLINTPGQYYTFDITNYIKTRIGKGFKISSFVLSSGTTNTSISFNTKEALANKPIVLVNGH